MDEDTTQSETKGNKNTLIILAVLVFLAVSGVLYFLSRRDQVETNSGVTQGMPANGSNVDEMIVAEEGESDVREVPVEGNEFQYTPSSFSVNAGERVRIIFTNIGNQEHDLVIEEFGVATKTIAKGETEIIEFTADKSGTFEFYCSVGNHRDLGMQGDVHVE